MPLVNGQFEYWWNWSTRDPANGRMQILFTKTYAAINREQMFALARTFFPYLDYADFSCELTSVEPPNKRALVPLEYRMNRRQMELLRHIPGATPPTPNPTPKPANRSILYGTPTRQPEKRRDVAPDRSLRRVSVLFGQ